MHPLVWVYAHNTTMWDGVGVFVGYMGHCWSLCLEEQFYLIWPFVLILPLSWVRHGALWAIAFIVGMSLFLEMWVGPMISKALYFAPPFGAMCLLAGALLAFNEHAMRDQWRACIIGVVLLGFGLAISPVSPLIHQYAGSRVTIAGMVTATGVMMVALSGSLPFVRWLLTMRWLTAVGVISYGLYIWHFGIYCVVGLLGEMDGGNDMLALGLGLTFGVSILSYHLYEKPVRNTINRWADAGMPLPWRRQHSVGKTSTASVGTGGGVPSATGEFETLSPSEAEPSLARPQAGGVSCRNV